ncbi:MAG: response regulator transcription factor [Methylobacterium sp.]
MSHAVAVLIIDEPPGLDPNFRATLEHTPALRTIGEEDLGRGESDNAVVLVCVRDSAPEAACERIAALRDGHPSLRIVVVFQTLSSDDLRRLLAAGADAFIGRGIPARDVCGVILGLAGATAEFDVELRERGFIPAPETLSLTPREAEVLRFLSAGFSNKEVARRLSLSVRTVETHRLNLRRKTQTGRLKDLVMLARQLGLDPVVDVDLPRRVASH